MSVLELAHWAAAAIAQYDSARLREVGRALGITVAPESNWIDPRGLDIPLPLGILVARPSPAPSSRPSDDDLSRLVADAFATRNALVVVSADHITARVIEESAARLTAAGAPAGLVQVVPSLDDHAAAARVIAVRPRGTVPALVDTTADLDRAAQALVDSAASNAGQPVGSESVLIAEESIADALLEAMTGAGAFLVGPEQRDQLRSMLGTTNVPVIPWMTGIEAPEGTRLLVAPIDAVVIEEPLARRTPGPVLAILRVPDVQHGITAMAAAVRLGEPHGTVVVHSEDARVVMRVAGVTEPGQLVVNAGGAGAGTDWDYDGPGDLVRWVRVLGPMDSLVLPGDWGRPLRPGVVPPYPVASNLGPPS